MGSKRVFNLRALSEQSRINWVSQLKQVIECSTGYQTNMFIQDDDFSIEFHRFYHITESEFLEKAETGDIVLFRGNHLGGKLTRKWTKGHSDHAAMIVKLDTQKGEVIYFLESVLQRGVTFTSWENFKKINQIYDDVFYRKLNCERDEEFLSKFQRFIDLVEGNNYSLNIKNFLFKGGSVVISDDLELEKRKFFCSELIVKAYKELGLLNTTKTSSSFSPHDLSALAKSPI